MRNLIRPVTRFLFNVSCLGARRGPHVTRYSMYQKLACHAGHGLTGRTLSISGSEELCARLGFSPSQIVNTQYPDVSILALPYADNSFDAVIADQVLEHVRGDPQQAMRESFRVVKRGGLVVHTTCQIMARHMIPHDYWRFTPDGLRFLAESHGDVLEAAGWGHPSIMILDLLGLRHEPIPEWRWHPANMIARANRDTWPVVTWVVARKRG